jgi:type VI secretion system protein ImpC
MSEPISFGELDFNLVSGMNGPQGKVKPETPFRIAVLGDFTGRAQRGIIETGTALTERRVIEVDRDTIDARLSALKVQISLPATGENEATEVLSFKEIDDFHPDRMVERLGLFQALQSARKKADDPKAFAEALGRLTEKPKAPKPPPPVQPIVSSKADFLDQVLDATAQPPEERKTAPKIETEWDRYLQGLVAPHTVPDTTDLREKLKSELDAAAGDMMTALLHFPDFQRLEAIWRGLSFLVHRVETDEHLQLFLIDITQEELSTDLRNVTDLQTSGLYKLLVEKSVLTPGAQPWSLLVGAYTFSSSSDDIETLGRIAKIARQAGAPFISAAGEEMIGCRKISETPDAAAWPGLSPNEQAGWDMLRRQPEASWIGLAFPRFLLRLPYGKDTDPTERFHFEEMPSVPSHEDYLWGNPAFACAYLIAKAFHRDEWQMRPGSFQDIERLPLHLYKVAGETTTKPCAEVLLTERTALKILDMGFMPLVSFKNQDMARIVRFQSIAVPPTQLAGRWGH